MLHHEPRATAALPSNVVHVPAVKQRTDFSCGASAALCLLRFWRDDEYARVEEADLFAPLQTTPGAGTEPEPIAAYLRDHAGLETSYLHGDVTLTQLEQAVDAGQPPLVDLQCWRDTDAPWAEVWDAGHYAILVGYDSANLFFMDPSVLTPEAYAFMPRGELNERWHDTAGPQDTRLERMVVFVRGRRPLWTPGDALPSSATRLG
jgi:predicted double-glycine peptidase